MTSVPAFRAFATVAALLAVSPVASVAAQAPPVRSNHLDSPVYYELNEEELLPHESNLERLAAGLLTLRHFPAVGVSGFDWTRGEVDDFSWWVQVEELRFLLPFIGSDRSGHKELATRWFKSWYASQALNPTANEARWGEPMSAAWRVMVLVYFLKVVEAAPDPDSDLAGLLRESIQFHQAYLADPDHFADNSNHGLVEAMALLETTRVFPDRGLESLGLERMQGIVDVSVSKLGVHMEHSPVYHFVFLHWLERFTSYLVDLPHLDPKLTGELRGYCDRMEEVAYYMYDHSGVIAQIGDSDSVSVEDRYPDFVVEERGGRGAVLFDPEAGYAVYKGDRTRGDKRYVVLTNQNTPPVLYYHYHDDVLSVYYSHDGETILGDAGKYEYTYTSDRRYFTSPAAHNTVFPAQYVRTRRPKYSVFLADTTALVEDGRETSFFARVRHSSADVERTVRIGAGSGITVEDVLTWTPVMPDTDSRLHGTKKPQYWAMVWNPGPAVAAIEQTVSDTSGVYEWNLSARSGRQYRLRIEIDPGPAGARHSVEVLEASRSPVMGWYSPAMFVKRGIPSVLVMIRPEATARITTTVGPAGGDKVPFALRILLKGY